MNENLDSSKSGNKSKEEASNSARPKINEYRPSSKPTVKMGAGEVLSIVHDRIEKVSSKLETTAQRNEVAADQIRNTSCALIEQLPQAMAEGFRKSKGEFDEALIKQFKSFQTWCKRWMMCFVAACCCAVIFLIMAIYMGINSYQANSRTMRMKERMDSVQRREQIFEDFAAEYPDAFERWLKTK